MILGIMQPYFFPYFEHFRLIEKCDQWIIFDTPQYSRKSWINRNRILNREKGWGYLSVPVEKKGLKTSIKDAPINKGTDWRKSIFDKLRIYQQEAPGYATTVELLEEVLGGEYRSIAELNIAGLCKTCKRLGITTPIDVISQMELSLPENCPPGEWAMEICKAVGATRYINPSGGVEIFDAALYCKNGISLEFHEHIDMKYATGSFEFVDNLSVIDFLMWNGKSQLDSWLDQG